MLNTTETAIHTPWGMSQGIEPIVNGIDFISCAGHGGIRVSPALNSQIPGWLKDMTFNRQGWQGWYEEDCDWGIPIIVFAALAERQARRTGKSGLIEDAYRVFNRFHSSEIKLPMVGNKADEKELKGLYLGLYHGRETVEKDIDNWGDNGPLIGPLKNIRVVYMTDIQLEFENRWDALKYGLRLDQAELTVKADCVAYRNIFYGDWKIHQYS